MIVRPQYQLPRPTFSRGFGSSGAGTDYVSFGTVNPIGPAMPWSVFAIFTTDNQASFGNIVNKRNSFGVGGSQFSFGNEGGEMVLSKNASNLGGAFLPATAPGRWITALGCGSSSGADMYLGLTDLGGTEFHSTGDWSTGSGSGQTLAIGRLVTEGIRQWQGKIALVALWNQRLPRSAALTLMGRSIHGFSANAGAGPSMTPAGVPRPVFLWTPRREAGADFDLIKGSVGTLNNTKRKSFVQRQAIGGNRRFFPVGGRAGAIYTWQWL